MVAPGPGQLAPQTFAPLEIDQLFRAELDSADSAQPLGSVSLAGQIWVKLGREGTSDFGITNGDKNGMVRADRRLLVGALCTYGDFEPFNLIAALMSEASKKLHEAQKPLDGIPMLKSVVDFGHAQRDIVTLQRRYNETLTESLNAAVERDPRGLMVSVVDENHRFNPGRQGLSGFALLHSLTFEGVEPKTKRPIVKPILRAAGESPGALPEGQAVKALFTKAA